MHLNNCLLQHKSLISALYRSGVISQSLRCTSNGIIAPHYLRAGRFASRKAPAA